MIVKALAMLLLACLLGLGIQSWRVSHYRAKADALQGVANTLRDANQTNIATIADLKHANEAWASKYAADVAKAKQEADASRQSDAATIDKLTQLSKKLAGQVNHDKYVKNWADVPVPEPVSRLLAEGSGKN